MAQQKCDNTPASGWHEIASGDIGDLLHWKPGYEVLEQAEDAINLLQNLEKQTIDWNRLIHDMPRFSPLPDILRVSDFAFLKWGEIQGFNAIEGDRQEETGSMSGEWTQMWLEMDHSNKQTIFHDFAILLKRLTEYPPLQQFQ